MRKGFLLKSLLVVALTASLSGCLSVADQLEHQQKQVARGAYEEAYTEASQRAAEENADSCFWQGEAGALALMKGSPAEAIPALGAADNGFNDVERRYYGARAVDTAKALAVNDCVLPYAPEGLDRVFTNLYRGIAYGVQRRPDAMRVELNRARQRQYEWFWKCSETIADQKEEVLSQGLSSAQKSQMDEVYQGFASTNNVQRLDALHVRALIEGTIDARRNFGALKGVGNAYAAHLTGVVRWCAQDASLNDLAMATALAPEQEVVRADYQACQQGNVPQGRVWLYVEDGLAPKRIERPYSIPLPALSGTHGVFTASFNVPALVNRAAASEAYAVNGYALQPLTNVEALARDQFDRAYLTILMRQIVRTFLKVAAQEGGAAAIRASDSDASEAIALCYELGMMIYDVSTNAADVRCADLLPKTVWMTALPRPKNGVLQLTPQGGAPVTVSLVPQGNVLVWVRNPVRGGKMTILVVDLDQKEGNSK
ncbi:MAG: hypothetical protein RR417_05200 [Kiritimatiellia bacterium]